MKVFSKEPGDKILQTFVTEKRLNSARRRELAQLFFALLRRYWMYRKRVSDDFPLGEAYSQENLNQAVAEAFLTDVDQQGEAFFSSSFFLSERKKDSNPNFDPTDWINPRVWPLFDDSFVSQKQALQELQALQQKAFIDLRVNTFAGFSLHSVAQSLCADHFFVEELPWSLGLRLQEGKALNRNFLYKQGAFEFQDFSSQCLSKLCLAPLQKDQKIFLVKRGLDYCAGGGGKSLALLQSVSFKKLEKWVLADIDISRLQSAQKRFDRIENEVFPTWTSIRQSLFSFMSCQEVTGTFDFVLIDVPCSGSGTLRRNPWFSVSLSPERIQSCAQTQKEILKTGSRFVKAGGRLVYMTCSLFAEENENVVNDFLQKHSDFFAVDMALCWENVFFQKVPGSFLIQNKFIRILPSFYHSDGFFIAILEKRNR